MSIGLPPKPAVYLLSASLPLLVLSESKSSLTGHFLLKTVSSLAFLSGPLLHVSKTPSPYGVRMAAGFVFSLIGDILLVPSRKEYYAEPSPSAAAQKDKEKPEEPKISASFQLGVVAFAAAHIAYILAFMQDAQSVSWPKYASTLAVNMLLSKLLGVIYPSKERGWANLLNLSIPLDMKPLVSAYAMIIGSMMAVAVAATSSGPGAEAMQRQRLIGAAMFVASDVFVAKDAFGKKKVEERKAGEGKTRKHWLFLTVGWGLYFWGQMVLAGTVTH